MPENKTASGQLYDLAVIGSGPGGYTAAIRAAQLGAKVVVVEKEHLGGTCTNKGCIPTKALVAAVETLDVAARASHFGIKLGNPQVDFAALQKHKNGTVERLRKGIEWLFKSYAIDLVRGTGKFTGQAGSEGFSVEVAGDKGRTTSKAKQVIIATGSVPASIPGAKTDGEKILNSDHILELSEIPPSLLIVGAGAIGLEFACIFNALGSKVTLAEMMPQIAPGEDEETAGLLKRSLAQKGIAIMTGVLAEGFRTGTDSVQVKFTGEQIQSEAPSVFAKVLIAVGRKPYLGELGLEQLGVETDGRQMKVNARMETNCPGIYAIGDAIGAPLLAHVAAAEGIAAAENALGRSTEVDYRVIPNCIYTSPEMASVGLTEAKANQAGYKAKVGKFPFSANGRALAWGETEGQVKVVADDDTGEVLGVQILGPQATELIGQAAVAIKLEATIEEFSRISWAHPTFSEAIMEAAADVRNEAIDLPRKL